MMKNREGMGSSNGGIFRLDTMTVVAVQGVSAAWQASTWWNFTSASRNELESPA
uniref:Uncharacterized protein n=1 Tax=Nelumbo nucifera TaxID=4432 RepID=A0A822YQK4_NELNU|nr:TPA_asm: hypothetical protein HUJ06_010349 [Nelumbo nucifera]